LAGCCFAPYENDARPRHPGPAPAPPPRCVMPLNDVCIVYISVSIYPLNVLGILFCGGGVSPPRPSLAFHPSRTFMSPRFSESRSDLPTNRGTDGRRGYVFAHGGGGRVVLKKLLPFFPQGNGTMTHPTVHLAIMMRGLSLGQGFLGMGAGEYLDRRDGPSRHHRRRLRKDVVGGWTETAGFSGGRFQVTVPSFQDQGMK